MTTDERHIRVAERPVCDVGEGTSDRCRKTATAMYDGIRLCPEHEQTAEVARFARRVLIDWR